MPSILVGIDQDGNIINMNKEAETLSGIDGEQAAGKSVRPGQRVKLIFTRGGTGVHAWDLPYPPDPSAVNVEYYQKLLLRAAANLLQPFGLDEEALLIWMRSDLGRQLELPLRIWSRRRPPPTMQLRPLFVSSCNVE